MAKIKKKLPGSKTSKSHEVISVSLPTKMSVPSDNLHDYSILIYGEKKIGKTSLCSYFKKTLFLMFETGGKALSIHQVLVKSWGEFKEYLKLVKKDKSFDTIIIDPVDIAYKYCLDYICRKLVIEHPSDEEWGKGWSAIRNEFVKEIGSLLATGKGVIFISHAADKEIKTRTGDKYNKIMPTMSNQAREVLEGVVDIWAYYCYDDKQRVLIIEGDDHVGAGHRLEGRFKYTDGGESIRQIDMGKSASEAFLNFVKAFNNLYKRKGGSSVIKRKKIVIRKKK